MKKEKKQLRYPGLKAGSIYGTVIFFIIPLIDTLTMNPNITFLIMLVGMMALMFFMQRSQKKQAQKRMESLNKLQKGYEVITIGGLYGTVDEVDTEKGTIVLDVDGVYLTFELAAIKTVLPLKETASLEGAIEK